MREKPLVLISHPIPEEWVKPFQQEFEFCFGLPHIAGVDITQVSFPERILAVLSMLSDRVDGHILKQMPNLKVVSNMAAGTDNVDLQYCRQNGIRVGNTPGVLTDATADLTMALLLTLSRRILSAEKDAKAGNWMMWEPAGWLGDDLQGSTLGIYGYGKIGQAVAKRAKAFGMNLIYNNRKPIDDLSNGISGKYVSFEELLKESDFLSIHAPLNSDSRGRFSRLEFSKMKRNAVLLNIGRGAIVDTDALVEALESGIVAGAALDVTDPEPLPPDHRLYQFQNCLITPHIGSATGNTRKRMFNMAMDNIAAALKGEELPYPVA